MQRGFLYEDNTAEALKLLDGATLKAAREIGGKVQNYARQSVEKSKGPMSNPWPHDIIMALRDSIAIQVEGSDGNPVLSVGSNMQIAPYIELGTGKEYSPPPEWEKYQGDDRHSVGGLEYWFYFDELEGAIKIGKPVPSQPYLRPAFLDHIDEYKDIVEKNMKNA